MLSQPSRTSKRHRGLCSVAHAAPPRQSGISSRALPGEADAALADNDVAEANAVSLSAGGAGGAHASTASCSRSSSRPVASAISATWSDVGAISPVMLLSARSTRRWSGTRECDLRSGASAVIAGRLWVAGCAGSTYGVILSHSKALFVRGAARRGGMRPRPQHCF